jgi:capsular exopolysaccharide synthesis family protein
MANVWEAMKKRQAEMQAAKAKPAADAPAPAPEQPSQDEAAPDAQPGPETAPVAPDSRRARGPAVGLTGEDRSEDYPDLLIAHHDRGGQIAEEFRALRTSLLAKNTEDRLCVLVTSAASGEGKTVTCANLGVVLAERTDRVTIIVDADLRKGRLARLLQAGDGPGLSEMLRGEAQLADCVMSTPYPNLFFLPTGKAEPGQVGELLGRPELEEIVRELRKEYDYVIFDTPPINSTADAGSLGSVVGEAIVVVRMNKTRRESVDKAISLLHAANVETSGLVLTHRRYHVPNYLYRYA